MLLKILQYILKKKYSMTTIDIDTISQIESSVFSLALTIERIEEEQESIYLKLKLKSYIYRLYDSIYGEEDGDDDDD